MPFILNSSLVPFLRCVCTARLERTQCEEKKKANPAWGTQARLYLKLQVLSLQSDTYLMLASGKKVE
jgi:hypothetical protein